MCLFKIDRQHTGQQCGNREYGNPAQQPVKAAARDRMTGFAGVLHRPHRVAILIDDD